MALSEKNLDRDGRYRNRTVAFRLSDAEADRLNQLVAISGLTKQDYITQCLLDHAVVVKPSFYVYQKVHREVFRLYDELAGFRGSGTHEDFSGGEEEGDGTGIQRDGDAPVHQDSRIPQADSSAASIIGRFLRRGGEAAEGAGDGR